MLGKTTVLQQSVKSGAKDMKKVLLPNIKPPMDLFRADLCMS